MFFLPLNRNPVPSSSHSPSSLPPAPSPRQPQSCGIVSIGLPLLDILYKWNHPVCGLSCDFFHFHKVLKVHLNNVLTGISTSRLLWLNDTLLCGYMASLVAQVVKNPHAMWKTWVRYLGWEDPLEKGKATHSSILAWRIPWTT